jgi:hypothetical protein
MDSEEAIRRRIEGLESWLEDQGVDVKTERAHLDQDSRAQLYWHYGYLVGLKDSLNALTREEPLPLH